MNFENLKFGAPAAERDIAHGLADYFVESEAFRRVSSREKFIVLGNRGVGKSAVFKIMAARAGEHGKLAIELRTCLKTDFIYYLVSRRSWRCIMDSKTNASALRVVVS